MRAPNDEAPVASDDNKKQPPPKKKPLGVGGFIFTMTCGGQVVYLLTATVVTSLTNAVFSPEFNARLDNLFLSSSSSDSDSSSSSSSPSLPLLRVVNALQLGVRTSICAFCVLGTAALCLMGTAALSAGGFLFFYLNAPNGEVGVFLKHRYDISLQFLGAIPIGAWALPALWRSSDLLQQYAPFESIGPHLIYLAGIGAVALLKLSSDAETRRQKERLEQSQGAVASALLSKKVGTIRVDDGENNQERDVSAQDVVSALKNATSSVEDRAADWRAASDLPITQLSRVACGVVYGLALGFAGAFVVEAVVPMIKSFVLSTGDDAAAGGGGLYGYWRDGLRSAMAAAEKNRSN